MTEHQSEYELRKEKIEQLRNQGIDPYPASSGRTSTVEQFLDKFTSYEESEESETFTGRIRLKRKHGKITFSQLQDASGTVQIVFAKNEIKEELYAFTTDYVDVGDIVEITGKAFTTKKGEQSILASNLRILSKSIEPLPDKWHGLQDEEARYRKRYLDMLMNPELTDMFFKKSKFWNSIRNFLQDESFLEVETPVLETTPGGADAEPFTTHHNALDIDLYLRISMGELWQKRLMVAGFEKTFEIGRQFRNEGLSPEHLQDYTQMEFYWAYADYEDGMKLVERMYKHCIMETFGRLKFKIGNFEVDFDSEWEKVDYVQEIIKQLQIDITIATIEEIRAKCDEIKSKYEPNAGKGRLVDILWKHCRKGITGPAFLVDHPVEVSPLAKRRADKTSVVERFQVLIAGSEQGNGYSELNDPIDQANRFQEQAELREAGDAEAQMHDQDFVTALEYGMPPTCGFGVSERLFAFLVNKPIRETVMFPLQRPRDGSSQASEPVKSD